MTRIVLIAACLLGFVTTASADDYASQITRYRRAHGQSAVRADAHLAALALQRTRAEIPMRSALLERCQEQLAEHTRTIRETFEDLPEIRDWSWPW